MLAGANLKLAPSKNECNVLSFESFDMDINVNYGCNVHSFDPFVEAKRFADIRQYQNIDYYHLLSEVLLILECQNRFEKD